MPCVFLHVSRYKRDEMPHNKKRKKSALLSTQLQQQLAAVMRANADKESSQRNAEVYDLYGFYEERRRYEKLQFENTQLKRRIEIAEAQLQTSQRRLADMTVDWKKLKRRIKSDETSDIICDFIAEFYHNELLGYLKSRGLEVHNWSDVSAKLSTEFRHNETLTRDLCCECACLTPEEWESLYDFKRTRNMRVHPKRNEAIVRRILREFPDGVLKMALQKMFAVIRLS